MTAVVITRDLMDGSRFRAALPEVVVVRSLEAPELSGATLILLDLALGLDAAAVVVLGPPVVAYGAHVDTEALDAAIAAGCVDALPRSKVFRRVADLLS
jgi:hypothetical protein